MERVDGTVAFFQAMAPVLIANVLTVPLSIASRKFTRRNALERRKVA